MRRPTYTKNRFAQRHEARCWSERDNCSPPTKASRVRFAAASLPDFLMWGSCRTMPLVGGVFSPISHFPRPGIPELLRTHLASPPSALKTSMLRAAQIFPFQFGAIANTPTIFKDVRHNMIQRCRTCIA
ncbi:hypothetical protein PR048_016857, partial [Dryococelus australis]